MNTSSLLARKLNQDRMEELHAEEKVAGTQALRPSASEIRQSDQIIRKVSQAFNTEISETGLTEDVKEAIAARVNDEINKITSSYEERSRLRKITLNVMFGLGPIESYMAEGSPVSDIVVHRYNHICVEDETGVHRVDAEFNSEEHLRNVIARIVQQVGRQINIAMPAVDAKLPDGSRIHATIPPISPDGATLTIRRFNTQKLEPEDYIRLGTLNEEMLEFLKNCVKAKVNILVSGGTGSGKTTLLNMLSGFIPENELIVTVEDNCELQLRQPNVRRLEARYAMGEAANISIQDLVRHSLRMRPDRIIVGEVRDGTIVDMLSAMSTGHEGSMSTIHATSPRACIDSRIPTLFSMYGTSFTRETEELMTAEAIQLIVQISREPDHKRKITHITAVEGCRDTSEGIVLKDLFRYLPESDTFSATEEWPDVLERILKERGIDLTSFLNSRDRKGKRG